MTLSRPGPAEPDGSDQSHRSPPQLCRASAIKCAPICSTSKHYSRDLRQAEWAQRPNLHCTNREPSMSAQGHSRPGRANSKSRHVRYAPDSDQILHLAEMTRRANYRHRAPAKAAAIRLALVSLLQLIGYLVECGLDAGFVFLAARCARSSSACLRRSLASRPVRITRGSERRQKPRAIPPNKGEPICRRPGLENPRQRLPTVLS